MGVRGDIQLGAVVAATLATGAGCAHQYLYAPAVSGATGDVVAQYLVPPSAPRGQVYVTSFGFAEMQLGPARTATMLHLRLVVSNGGAVPWTLDADRQRVVVMGEEPQGPTLLNSNAGEGPVYEVPPSSAGVFDLYYALEPPLDPEYVGGFALDWSISAGGEIVARRTWCLRYEAQPVSYARFPPYVAVGLGFGGGWWRDPSYLYPLRRTPAVRSYHFPAGALRGAAPEAAASPLRAAPVARPFVSRLGRGWRGEGLPFRNGR